MRLRLELFVESVPTSHDFYTRVLGFDVLHYHPREYSVFRNGDVQIALQARTSLTDDHPVKPLKGERPGLGIEIVLEVDNIKTIYERVRTSGWELSDDLGKRPWGMTDFRVIDPDGHYIRITETSAS
jgi:catechol 2,3-dioxygenase-like lactoylglutathione lyase family enzyme